MKKLVTGMLLSATMFAAQAAAVFVNLFNFSTPTGDCAFSTTCAADRNLGNVYAAQLFTLSGSTTLTSASFTIMAPLGELEQPSDVTWMFLLNDGADGLPGSLLAFGVEASITGRTVLGTNLGLDFVEATFALPSVNLATGSYYFALHVISLEHMTYLGEGMLGAGAAETLDGGESWQFDYQRLTSVAVSLFGEPGNDVPEPGSLALLGLGLLGAGVARHLKR